MDEHLKECITCGHIRARHIDRAGVNTPEPCDEDGCPCLSFARASGNAEAAKDLVKAWPNDLQRVLGECNRKICEGDYIFRAGDYADTTPHIGIGLGVDDDVEEVDDNHRAMMLADECQTLRDANTQLLAENARLRRALERKR